MNGNRKPLSLIIAMGGKKPPDDGKPDGDEPDGDEGGGKYDDPGLISACEDAIDAMKNRDAQALSAAWGHYLDIRESMGEPDADDAERN